MNTINATTFTSAQTIMPEDSRSLDEIQTWLVSKFASITRVDFHHIDIKEDLGNFGLSSIQTMQLTADLSDWMGKEFPETLIWEHQTIEELAIYLYSGTVLTN